MKSLLKYLFPLLLAGVTLTACGGGGVVADLKDEGESCQEKNECKGGLDCKGAEGSKTCQKDGGKKGVGKACEGEGDCKQGLICVTVPHGPGAKICAKECSGPDGCTAPDTEDGGDQCLPGATNVGTNSSVSVCSSHGAPKKGPHEACTGTPGECKDGLTCVTESGGTSTDKFCAKVCTDAATDCSVAKGGELCTPGVATEGSDQVSICTPKHGPHEPCENQEECEEGLTCLTSPFLDSKKKPQKVCARECTAADAATVCTEETGGKRCVDGATKDGSTGSVSVCATKVGLLGACESNDDCGSGFCLEGEKTCVEKCSDSNTECTQKGYTCATETATSVDSSVTSRVCKEAASTTPGSVAGGPCKSNKTCDSDLTCVNYGVRMLCAKLCNTAGSTDECTESGEGFLCSPDSASVTRVDNNSPVHACVPGENKKP